jgi:hypothetical protein
MARQVGSERKEVCIVDLVLPVKVLVVLPVDGLTDLAGKSLPTLCERRELIAPAHLAVVEPQSDDLQPWSDVLAEKYADLRLDRLTANALPIGVPDVAPEDAATRAEAWIERSRSAGLMSPVPEADRTAFWSWLDGMNAAALDTVRDSRSALTLNRRLWEAVRTSAHICLSASEAASSLVPAEMMGELHMEHSVLVAGRYPRRAGRHQMLGVGRDVQGAPRHALEVGDMLLLQLDTDWAMPWMLGDCGVLQYWISVSDLRAQRFDKVRVTLEGH